VSAGTLGRPRGCNARDKHEEPELERGTGCPGHGGTGGGASAISCFSRTAELNICRGETRVTSQFPAISGGDEGLLGGGLIVGYPRVNDTVAFLEHPRARSNIDQGDVWYRRFFCCFASRLSANNFYIWVLRPDVRRACNLRCSMSQW